MCEIGYFTVYMLFKVFKIKFSVGKMLSMKRFCFMTLLSLVSLLPGKKGKMYLVEAESEKKSANTLNVKYLL